MEKPKRRYTRNYPQMEAALTAVANKEMNGEQAAEMFGIPPSTLRDRLNGRHTKKIGRPTSFTEEEELEICDILLSCMKVGAPLNKRKLTGIVRAIGLAKGIDEAKFGNRWHRGLLRRHPDISVRVISATSFKKAREWTKDRCEGWIGNLQNLADRGFLDDPNGIWNLDESGFQLAQIYDKVYAQKGAKEVPAYVKGSETDRENMTLLALGNAAGKMLRPLILYKGKMHIESHFTDTNDECFLSTNSSGVMDPFVLHDYLEKEWSTSITTHKNVLFFDGHSSHLNCIQFLAACMNNSEKEIEVMCLPSGQTAFLQPLDRKVFGGVKQKWTKYLQDSRLDTSVDVTKRNFPSHIVKLWRPDGCVHSFNFSGPLKDGFEKTGIYPFSPELLRDTVDSNLESGLGEVSEEIESQYQEIRRISQEKLSISEDKTNACILQIKQVISGKPIASVIAREFHGHLLKAAPKKKRLTKDSRLDTSHGLALVHSGYISLKADKIRASKEAKTKKRNDTAVNRTPAVSKVIRKSKTATVRAKAAAKPSESQAGALVDPAVSSSNLGNSTAPARKAREGKSVARFNAKQAAAIIVHQLDVSPSTAANPVGRQTRSRTTATASPLPKPSSVPRNSRARKQ